MVYANDFFELSVRLCKRNSMVRSHSGCSFTYNTFSDNRGKCLLDFVSPQVGAHQKFLHVRVLGIASMVLVYLVHNTTH